MKLSRLLKFIKRGRLKSFQGFSLVEVMVVVAIIGILASIAIPNFQRFRRRSMQVEPKTVMSGLYSSQIVFSSEWNGLTVDFAQLGFDIGNHETTRYITGWTNRSEVPSSSDTWYHGPPAPSSSVLHISPSQCVDQSRCDNDALEEAFSAGPKNVFTKSDGDCEYCTDDGQLKKGSNTSCNAASSTCKYLWQSGQLKKRQPLLQFVIGPSGDIGGGQADQWHMNFNKKLTLVQDGAN